MIMKYIKEFFTVILVLSAMSCTKDKGNYVYTTEQMDAIEIDKDNLMSAAAVFKQGVPVEIDALYTINDITITDSDLSFEWIMGGEVVGTGPTLHLEPFPAAEYNVLLVITEHKYGITYSKSFQFKVEPTYSDGWAILSDNGTLAQLGYLTKDASTENPDEYVYTFEGDVYANANMGKTLATGSGPMTYHIYNSSSQMFGLSILQPGEEGPVDLYTSDMSVAGRIRENFLGEVPSGDFMDVAYKVAGIMGGSDQVCAFTEDGQVYLRKEYSYNGSYVPFAGKFSAPLVLEDGYRISHVLNTSRLSLFSTNIPVVICYDELNNRCMYIQDAIAYPFTSQFYTDGDSEVRKPGAPGYDGVNTINEIAFPGPENLSDYNVLKMIGCGYDMSAFFGAALSVVMLLEDKDRSGDYYVLVYACNMDYGFDIDLKLFFKWPDNIPIDPETMLIKNYIGGVDRFFFTTTGNKEIYAYDFNNNRYVFRKVYASDTEITAFGQGETGNMMGPGYGIYSNTFVVGDADGNLKVLNMDDNAYITGKPEVLYECQTDAGAITGIEYIPTSDGYSI